MGKRKKRENAATDDGKPEDAVAMSRSNSETLPEAESEAEQEIINRLFAQMSGKTEEMVAILKNYGMRGDDETLQNAFLKRKVQRIMAKVRDKDGNRQVLSTRNGEYIVVPRCDDLQALQAIGHGIETQMGGLNQSAGVVSARIRFLKEGRGDSEETADKAA